MRKTRAQTLKAWLFSSRLRFGLPKKTKYLIYDSVGHELLLCLFTNGRVLKVRGEENYIWLLIWSFFSSLKNSNGLLENYVFNYIRLVNPLAVITYSDMSLIFPKISKSTGIKTVLFQNGIRGAYDDGLKATSMQKSERYVDLIFVFSRRDEILFSQFFSGKIYVVGSLKNNLAPTSELVTTESILFISQYRRRKKDGKMFRDSSGEYVDHCNFYSTEKEILPTVESWCKENRIQLHILGGSRFSQEEYCFYASFLENFEFHPRSENKLSCYSMLDFHGTVIFVNSTLGYEALSRGLNVRSVGVRRINGISFAEVNGFDDPNSVLYSLDNSEFKTREILESTKQGRVRNWDGDELMVFDQNAAVTKRILKQEGICDF